MTDPAQRADFLRLAVLFESSLIAIAAGLGWVAGVNPAAALFWQPEALAWGAAGALLLFALFLIAIRYPVGPLDAIKSFLLGSLGPSIIHCRWYDLLLISAVAGIGEELLFRGLFQPWLGLWWSNILFGLAHCVTPAYALLAGAVGLFLGWMLQETGNLLPEVVTHSLYDFLAFLVLARISRRGERAAVQAGELLPEQR